MFVKFASPAGASFAMPRDVAVSLLKIMGASGGVPGALTAEDVPSALERLRRGIAESTPSADQPVQNKNDRKNDDDQQPPISLATRAYPLLQLLMAAAKNNKHVLWEESGSPIF
jgi:hypothetical protein